MQRFHSGSVLQFCTFPTLAFVIICYVAFTYFELTDMGWYPFPVQDTTQLRVAGTSTSSLEEFSSGVDCSMDTDSNDKAHPTTYVSSGCLICSRTSRQQMDGYRRKSNNALSIAIGLDSHSNGSSDISHAFTNIYDKSIWGPSGGGSGGGSDTAYAKMTGYLLELVLLRYGLSSMLDAPCGGVYDSWMAVAISRIRKSIPCFRYHGVDVVSSVIEKNNDRFKSLEWIKFGTQDLSSWTENLPTGYDLILSRDALQHLSYYSIAGALSKYCRTDSKFLAVGSYLDNGNNKNIKNGESFHINLRQPPFNFPAPVESIEERGVMSEKMAADLSQSLGRTITTDPTPTKVIFVFFGLFVFSFSS